MAGNCPVELLKVFLPAVKKLKPELESAGAIDLDHPHLQANLGRVRRSHLQRVGDVLGEQRLPASQQRRRSSGWRRCRQTHLVAVAFDANVVGGKGFLEGAAQIGDVHIGIDQIGLRLAVLVPENQAADARASWP